MNLSRIGYFFIVSTIIFTACQGKKEPQRVVFQKQAEEFDPLLEMNKKKVQLEAEDITLFLKRYDWKMKDSGTGLKYELLKQGTGQKADSLDVVTLKYKIFLLTGEEIYNSEADGLKTFKLEKDYEVSGLHEAVRMMRLGDIMRLIMPSHLAYGLVGNREKVPTNSTLAYQIELINIIKE